MRTVTLYEFMPYGAPELIESRQRYMSRALLLTSATALVLCALAGAVAPLLPARNDAPRPTILDPRRFVIPPPLEEKTPPAPTPQAPVSQSKVPNAPPVAVPDQIAPPPETPASPASDGRGTDAVNPIQPTDTGAGAVGQVAPPPPEPPVYVEELPAVVKEVKPVYPPLAKEAGIEGLVLVKVLVGVDGRVREAVLDPKRQVPMLNEAALTAARLWVFTPGLASGRPVACWTAIPFRFRLH